MDIQDLVSVVGLARMLLGLTIVLLLAWWATRRHASERGENKDQDQAGARPR